MSNKNSEKISWWKCFLSTEIDTTVLQEAALDMFLEVLGYSILEKGGVKHCVRVKYNNNLPAQMALQKAVALYNNTYDQVWAYKLFSIQELDAAINMKPLRAVFLQRSKGMLIAHKHLVHFIKGV